MNKQKVEAQLRKIGMKVNRIEFSSAGYCLEVKLNKDVCSGWEELELSPIEGLEVIRVRSLSTYNGQLMLVPSTRKEFKDYLIRHLESYGMSKEIALEDLKNIIETYASAITKFNFGKYIESLGGMQNEI